MDRSESGKMEKSMWVEKLYEETVNFMEEFSINETVSVEDRMVLDAAYNNVNRDLNEIVSRKGLSEGLSEDYKSKVERELSDVVNKVSDLTIKDGYLRHLSDSNLSLQKEETLSSLIQDYMNLTKRTRKNKQKAKLPSGNESIFDIEHLITNHQDDDQEFYDENFPPSHDHSKCIANKCFQEEVQRFPGSLHIGDPIYQGKRFDLLAARPPVQEEFSFGADPEWMRQQFNLQYANTSPPRRMDTHWSLLF